jgi:hypothetical protein
MTPSRKFDLGCLALATAGVAMVSIGVFFSENSLGASKVNSFNYDYITTPIVYHDPDSTILFIPNEPMHIVAIQGAVSQSAAGMIGLYIVKSGLPCRDPKSNAPNGMAIFDQSTKPPTSFNVSGSPGEITTVPLSKVPGALALAPGTMICMIDTAQVDITVRANLTISLGP